MSWIERRMASALFGDVPSGTIEEALENFLVCEKLLEKEMLENKVFVTRCYDRLSQAGGREQWLRKALAVTPATEEVSLTSSLT